MPQLEFWLFAGALGGLVVGVLGVLWTRGAGGTSGNSWGRLLFVGTLLAQGGGSLLAAFHRADGLVPLGLSAGFLVVAMFVESPRAADAEGLPFAPTEEL